MGTWLHRPSSLAISLPVEWIIWHRERLDDTFASWLNPDWPCPAAGCAIPPPTPPPTHPWVVSALCLIGTTWRARPHRVAFLNLTPTEGGEKREKKFFFFFFWSANSSVWQKACMWLYFSTSLLKPGFLVLTNKQTNKQVSRLLSKRSHFLKIKPFPTASLLCSISSCFSFSALPFFPLPCRFWKENAAAGIACGSLVLLLGWSEPTLWFIQLMGREHDPQWPQKESCMWV